MKKLLFGSLVLVAMTSGCVIKQIHDNTDVTRAQTATLLEQQASSDSARAAEIKDLRRRLDAQDQFIRSMNATLANRLDGIDQSFTRMTNRLQDVTGRFTDVTMGMHEMQKRGMNDSTITDTVSAKTALNTAETDLARGNNELAAAGYSTFIERWGKSPMAPLAFFGRGQAKLAMKDTAGAIADFRVAGTATPPNEHSATALWQLGKLFRATGNLDGAKESWKQVVTNFPDTPEAARAKEQLDLLKVPEKKGKRK